MNKTVNIIEYKKILKNTVDDINKSHNDRDGMWYNFTKNKLWNFLEALKSLGIKQISEKNIEKTFNAINYAKLINGNYGIYTKDSFIEIDGNKYDCKQLNKDKIKSLINDIKFYPEFNENSLDDNNRIIISEKFIEKLNLSTMSLYAIIDLDKRNLTIIL